MLALLFSLFTLLLLPSFTTLSSWMAPAISMLLLSLFTLISSPSIFVPYGDSLTQSDQLSSALIILSLWISALMIIASQKIFINSQNSKPFYSFVIMLCLILTMSFCTRSMIMFYIFFEASLIPTLLLILGWGYQPERLQASMYLILYTVTASLPLLLSLMKIFLNSGHLSMALPFWIFASPASIAPLWWLITIMAFLVKTPLYLAHLWLPKAHVEAPVAGSMVLAGILLKLGSYGLLRISMKFMFLSKSLTPLITSISLIGGAITSFICIRQSDVKALIAYSSVSHMGLATAGILSNTAWGWQGAMTMLIAHGLCSSCMFAMANMTYETIGSRGMYITKGMMTLFPAMTFWWFCFSACNMAAPPSINLAAEIMLMSSAISISNFSVLPLSIMAFMAAAYSLFLYTSTQHGPTAPFQNPLSLFIPRNYSICLLHFIPLILFISKIEFIMSWL